MIGERFVIDGAEFYVYHLRCKQGLIHAVLSVNGGQRMTAPQHNSDSTLRDGELVHDEVLTCFTCINHQFVNTPTRNIFDDVDEDGSEQDDDD